MSKTAPFQRFGLLKEWKHFTGSLKNGQWPQIGQIKEAWPRISRINTKSIQEKKREADLRAERSATGALNSTGLPRHRSGLERSDKIKDLRLSA